MILTTIRVMSAESFQNRIHYPAGVVAGMATHQFPHPLFAEHFVGSITGFPDPVGADDDNLTSRAMGSPVGTVFIITA